MARTKTTVENLDRAINKILMSYGELCWHNIDEATQKVAKKVRLTLANESRQFDATGHWGKQSYSRGWRVKEEKNIWWNSYIIHNANKPTETHLLEYGHELNTGVRVPRPHPQPGTFVNTATRAKAYPHITPVSLKVPDQFQGEVVDAIRRSS